MKMSRRSLVKIGSIVSFLIVMQIGCHTRKSVQLPENAIKADILVRVLTDKDSKIETVSVEDQNQLDFLLNLFDLKYREEEWDLASIRNAEIKFYYENGDLFVIEFDFESSGVCYLFYKGSVLKAFLSEENRVILNDFLNGEGY